MCYVYMVHMYRILQKRYQHQLKEGGGKKQQGDKKRYFQDFAKLRKTELKRVEPLLLRKPIEPLITDRCCV